jgi:predicted ferric reductase
MIDLFARMASIRKGTYFKLETIGDLENKTECVVIHVKKNKYINTYPGCYFMLCINKISSLEWHPFSLLENKHDKLVFCAKVKGKNSWTDKLKTLSDGTNSGKNLSNGDIYFQGPYGLCNINYTHYKYIVNIAGGSGITSIFCMLDHIAELLYLNKLPKLQRLVFIWIIPHTSYIKYFNTKIIELNHYITDITIFVTKQKGVEGTPSYVKFTRPDLCPFIEKYILNNSIYVKDIGIITRGPRGLTEDVKFISNKLNVDVFCEDY